MGSRELSLSECHTLLSSKRVGRVVYTDGALPGALPVNYVIAGDDVVFRTGPTGRIAAAVPPGGAVLGFQVDSAEETVELGWQVLVVGLARRVHELAESLVLDGLIPPSWGLSGSGLYVRIPLTRVTGRAAVAPSMPLGVEP
jgi:hypothetical protein